ncbi:MAG: 2-dehydropantoate 2-reductase N-terminal domain-containing protein [Pseudomonadota bacterium]
MIKKDVAVIGAGNIGRLLTYKLVMAGYNVTLFNRPGSSSQANIEEKINNFQKEIIANENWGKLTLTFDLSDIKNNQIINYVAGAPRNCNESRNDLFHKNAKIVDNFLPTIAVNNPDGIIINAANPLDLLTRKIHETLRNNKCNNVIFGMGSSLDTTRLHDVIKHIANKPFAVIENAFMIGEHGPTMVAVLSSAKLDGKSFEEIFCQDALENIVNRTRDRGRQIILETEHSDIIGPAERLFEMNEIITNGQEAYLPCCLENEDGIFMGQMACFSNGKVTATKILMNDSEQQQINYSANQLKTTWQELNDAT